MSVVGSLRDDWDFSLPKAIAAFQAFCEKRAMSIATSSPAPASAPDPIKNESIAVLERLGVLDGLGLFRREHNESMRAWLLVMGAQIAAIEKLNDKIDGMTPD